MKTKLIIFLVLISLLISTPVQALGQSWLLSPISGIQSCGSPFGQNNPSGMQDFNNGLDFGCGLEAGTPVVAVADGKVVYTSWYPKYTEASGNGHGLTVVIYHDQTQVYTFYAHLGTVKVGLGQRVSQGDTIGLMGQTGYTNEPVTHFAVSVYKPEDIEAKMCSGGDACWLDPSLFLGQTQSTITKRLDQVNSPESQPTVVLFPTYTPLPDGWTGPEPTSLPTEPVVVPTTEPTAEIGFWNWLTSPVSTPDPIQEPVVQMAEPTITSVPPMIEEYSTPTPLPTDLPVNPVVQEGLAPVDDTSSEVAVVTDTSWLSYPIQGEFVRCNVGFGEVNEAGGQPFHNGIDLACGLPEGTPVLAVADGEVIYASWFPTFWNQNAGHGNTVVVYHQAQGVFSYSAHLSSFAVNVGDKVTKGQTIGYLGSTGASTGPHLHFAVANVQPGIIESLSCWDQSCWLNPDTYLGNQFAVSPSLSVITTCSLPASYGEPILQWCDLIEKWGRERGIDPKLIAALITQESGGDAQIISSWGAVGLMQIMASDGIAGTVTNDAGVPYFSHRPTTAELMDPDFNIQYGTQMLLEKGVLTDPKEALRLYGPASDTLDYPYYYADKVLSIYYTNQ